MLNEDTAAEKLEIIANTSDLQTAIKRLETKKIIQEEELRVKTHQLLESLKPTNILKNTLQEVRESTALKHNVLKVALGLGAGYFSRKLIVGESAGIIKKALGTALQYGITHFVAKKENDGEHQSPPKRRNIFKRVFSS